MSSSVTITPRAHWANWWFLRLFSRPVVRVDGIDHDASWGQPLQVDVAAGSHEVGVGVRYRGSVSVVGMAESRVKVEAGETLVVEARNGLFNHQPFAVFAP